MKKKKKILLWILLGIVVLIALFVYSQWDNISAVIDAFRYTQEEVVEKMEQNKEDLQNYIDENKDVNVRDLTQEEAEALNKGELTEKEVVEILTSKPDETQTETSNEQAEQKRADNKTEKEEAGKRLSEAIARLYIQKNANLSKLDAVEAEARARFIEKCGGNTPVEEQKPIKSSIISEYLPRVASWEKECDSVVYGILNEIKAALKESGQSMEIADKIEQAYLDEKSLKKSYFIGRYMD